MSLRTLSKFRRILYPYVIKYIYKHVQCHSCQSFGITENDYQLLVTKSILMSVLNDNDIYNDINYHHETQTKMNTFEIHILVWNIT